MDENKDMEIEATITEITQIGSVNEKVEVSIDGDDSQIVEIPIVGDESPKETAIINADLEKLNQKFSYFCDNCGGYTVFDKEKIDEYENGDGNVICAHCNLNLLDEIDLEDSMLEELDIIIPEKPIVPLGKFDMVISGNLLKAIVGNLSTLVGEAKLNISPNGIKIRAVDPAHVAMIAMDIPRSMADGYHADTLDLGIDVEKLSELSKMCKKDTVVKLELQCNDKNRLAYKVGIVSGDMIPLDTAGMSDPKLPNVNLPCHFDANVKDILDFCKRASTITNHIMIFADKEKVIFSANGESDNTEMVLTNGMDIQFLQNSQENARSLFSLDYFEKIIKALKPCAKTITMEIGTDYPIRIKTNLFNGEGDIIYMLAPRIEND